MTLQDLLTYHDCKTQGQLAEKIKISRVTLWKWKNKGIPFKTQTVFEVQSDGVLKADHKTAPQQPKTPNA